METFLIQTISVVMSKNTNEKKKVGTNFDFTTGYLIKKYFTISINFKIRISQVIAKIEMKQRSLNRIGQCLKGQIQI